MPNTSWYINQGETSWIFKLVVSEATTGNTLSFRYRAEGGSGTGTELGTASGAAADTEITFTLDWSGVAAGTYDIEVWEDFGGASERPLFPNADTTKSQVTIVDRFGLA